MSFWKDLKQKADTAKTEASDLWGGLTDTTGDIIESAQNFSNNAQDDFRTYVSDPIMEEATDAGSWAKTVAEDAKDSAEWAAKKAAEGYMDVTDPLLNPDDGLFGSVTDKIEQAWEAAEDGNAIEAAKKTGSAFIDAVDEIATGGLGETAYNWIMNNVNEGDGSGEMRYEIRGNIIKVEYLGQTVYLKSDNPEQFEKFIGDLGALAEGSGEEASDWATDAAATESFDMSDKAVEGEGYGKGSGADDYSGIKRGTDSAGREYVIGGL